MKMVVSTVAMDHLLRQAEAGETTQGKTAVEQGHVPMVVMGVELAVDPPESARSAQSL